VSQNTEKLSYPKLFILGARPRTLPAAISPVLVGTAIATHRHFGGISYLRMFLCLIVAISLQVGVNYANDYSDGIKGTDDKRVGPIRLVGSKLVKPKYVKYAAFVSGIIAAAAGLALAFLTSFWFIPVGLICLVAGWGYTGGPKPYGYMAMGELSVLIFFGFVATMGSSYAQNLHITLASFVAGLSIGLLACSILIANNLRDIEGDRKNNKRTLAVLLGDTKTRLFLVGSIVLGISLSVVLGFILKDMWTLLALLSFVVAVKPIIGTFRKVVGKDLVAVLKQTALIEITYAVFITIGLFIG
jgi:1,4-dihydroxy-2-naphthoate octaprenyltransferase